MRTTYLEIPPKSFKSPLQASGPSPLQPLQARKQQAQSAHGLRLAELELRRAQGRAPQLSASLTTYCRGLQNYQ